VVKQPEDIRRSESNENDTAEHEYVTAMILGNLLLGYDLILCRKAILYLALETCAYFV
jgi:hypothetical protein